MNAESFLSNIEASLKDNWDLSALTDFKGESYTYAQVARKIAQLHLVFEATGLQKGEKIAIIGRNSANWGIGFLAVISYGAVVVPILHEFTPENVHNIVNHSDSKLLFTGKSLWDSLEESAMPNLETIILIDDFSTIKSEIIKGDTNTFINNLEQKKYPSGFSINDINYHKDNREELAMISYTSGTTGFSKGVMLPYRSLLSNILFASGALVELKRGASIVSILPMAHMYGLAFEFLYEFIKGCHIHFLSKLPTPKIILEAFATVKPQLIITVPLIVDKIYKKQLLPAINKPFIKVALKLPLVNKIILNKINKKLTNFFGGNFFEVVIGGAAFNAEAESFFKRMGFKYTIGYGMTECGPLISYEDWKYIPLFSCGKAVPKMEIKINSEDPANIPGEILVRGDHVMLGYYKNPEVTAETLKNGWLYTGDLGVLDKNGYLYIKGRSKNMLLGPSGQNIYPEEIESKLDNTEYIAESVVIESDKKIVALVYLDPDIVSAENISDNDLNVKIENIRKEINSKLPAYSQIAQIKIHATEFEKTPKKSIKRFLYTNK